MLTPTPKWAHVTVNDYESGAVWCRVNLTYNDWVCCSSSDGRGWQFRFRDHAVATEFALRF
jgi:hypothetical protein